MPRWTHALLVLLLFMVGGCSLFPPPEPKPNEAFAFGYVTTDGSPYGLEAVWIRQYSPPGEYDLVSTELDDGVYYNQNLPSPGAYAFGGLQGKIPILQIRKRFYMSDRNKQTRFKTKPHGVYFIGSFQLKDKDEGWDLIELKSPTEKELLVKLISEVSSDSVKARLQARLKELQ